ncbi:hypothetical protein D3248_02840 [Leucobacter zeae]|nr:hypothetical protein [Leucobacter zeae]
MIGIPGGSGRRRATAVVAVLAGALALAGCTAIPDSGPVQVGFQDLSRVEDTGQIQYNPQSPVAGSSQEQLVRDFVQAATSSNDDYGVARQFLTPDYAGQWNPYDSVLIDSVGSREFAAEGDAAGVLSISATAKVDEHGLMLPVEPGPATDLRFEFELVGDEWRIASAPNGIVLDTSLFTTIWSSRQVYFVGPGEYLVPETRWFLSRATLTTEIVGALLEGPGERMRDAVRTAFPSGTTLVSNSVPVVDGRARIDLTSTILEADADTLAGIRQQLNASLQSVSGVSGFELFADGSPISTGAADGSAGPRPVNGATPPVVIQDQRLGTVISGEFDEWSDLGERIVDLRPQAVSVSSDDSVIAVQNAQGVSRVDAEGVALIDARPGQIAPSVDAFGYVWTAQKSSADVLTATGADGEAHRVEAPWLHGRAPVAVRISPDGSRIAALVRDDDESVVLVAGVVRGSGGEPDRTTEEAAAELWASGAPVDLDWVGQAQFAVLSRTGAATKVVLGGQGALSTELGSVPGGSRISGNGSRTQLRVLGDGGSLFSSQGGGWQRTADEVELLAKRG